MFSGFFLTFFSIPGFYSQMLSPAERIGSVQTHLGRQISTDHIVVLVLFLCIIAAFIFLIVYSYIKEKSRQGKRKGYY